MDQSVPKKKKKSWNPENLKAALEAIRNGSKIKAAARNFSIPESTIRDRLKLGENYDPPMGRKATFTQEEEKEMVSFITLMAKKFYGITQQQLRKLAYDFAVAKNIKNIFSSEKKMAGKCWVYSFLKRNPGISLRLPEPTSINRVLGFNKSEIAIFFTNLETLMTKHNFPANRIFNVDETGISNVQKPGKIYAPTGLKQVGKATSAERGQNVTVVCALSATGIYVSPMFIYPRQRIKPSLKIGGPPGAIYECSKSGWINEDLFTKWLHHFATNIGAHKQNPALLILDNHCSHQSLNAYEFCRENGIHLLSLPPHTSHKMQPLDVTFYGPLKSAYSRECDLFMKMHPFEKITHDHLASIFNKAYTRVATMEKAVKGFEVTGIYPLNPHIFDDEDILTADPIIEEVSTEVRQLVVENEFIEPAIGHDESTRSLPSSPSILNRSNEIRSHTPQRQTDQNPVDIFAKETAVSGISFNSCNRNKDTPSAALNEVIRKDIAEPSTSRRILEDLSPIPQKTIKIQRRVKKQHSIVLTSTPLKEQLEEKERKRQMKIAKEKNAAEKKVKEKKQTKGKSVKRRVLNSSETSEDEDNNMKSNKKKVRQGKSKGKGKSKKVIDSSSEDSMDDVPLTQLCDDDEDDDIENRDICAVCQEFGRNREIWFRCCRCAIWIHKECSGKDSANNFICDFCCD